MANTRAILLMTLAMAFFAVVDTCIKLASQTLGIGQILLVSSAFSALLFLPALIRSGTPLVSRDLLDRAVVVRTLGEVAGSIGIFMALSLIPLAMASALLQAQPLAVTLGAALFLGEAVGWRRWSAVLIGFAGVIVILRPGAAEFDPNALWCLLGILGLTARDLGTRKLPARVSTAFVSFWAMIALGLLGAILTPLQTGWQPVEPLAWLWIAGIGVSVSLAFITITAALRTGEVSAIAPFRYTRMVFALIIAMAIFGERPDAATWTGTAIIIGSGLYAYWRERRVRTARPLV